MKIHLFHDNAACAKIRLLMPAEHLRLNGHQVTASYGWGDTGKNEEALGAEVLVGQRLTRLEGSALWRRLKPGRRLVYELDDDFWHIDPSNLGAYLAHDATAKYAMETIIADSDLVTVSTAPLAEVVYSHNRNVVVLPNQIDARMFDLVRKRRQGKVVVGWAGGDSHVRDLALVVPTLRRLVNQNPDVELHTIGSDLLRLFKIEHRHTDWLEDLWDMYDEMDFDIALAPLTNTVFNQSKSGIKAMESMALGIPVIASDIEPYRGIVEDGVTGFLVRDRHKWMGRLRELANDQAMRERMGQAGKLAVGRMTIQTGWRLWEAAYEKVLARPGSGVT
jgi:glycosyltransferase involved in cell wall biosynthesis